MRTFIGQEVNNYYKSVFVVLHKTDRIKKAADGQWHHLTPLAVGRLFYL